jgi:hypothetical protein
MLIPPLHRSMHKNIGSSLWLKSTSGYYSTTEPCMPSWFPTIQKGDIILWKIWIYECLLQFFPSYFSLSHILPSPKDTHKEVSGSHSSVRHYPLDFQVRSPPNPFKCNFLYAYNSTAQTTFRRHQPSTSTLDQS